VSDVVEIAAALKTSPLTILEGVVELPDLATFLHAYIGDLAWKTSGVVEHLVAAVMWIVRYYRISQRLDYQPLYFTQSFRRPDEYIQAWRR